LGICFTSLENVSVGDYIIYPQYLDDVQLGHLHIIQISTKKIRTFTNYVDDISIKLGHLPTDHGDLSIYDRVHHQKKNSMAFMAPRKTIFP